MSCACVSVCVLCESVSVSAAKQQQDEEMQAQEAPTSESPLELSLIRVQIINFQLLSEAEAAATARETSRRRCNPSQAVTHFVDGFGIVLGLGLAAAKSPQLREYLVQFYWN